MHEAVSRGMGRGAVYGAALGAALWMTIDMDYPEFGMITVSNRPAVEALAAMK